MYMLLRTDYWVFLRIVSNNVVETEQVIITPRISIMTWIVVELWAGSIPIR